MFRFILLTLVFLSSISLSQARIVDDIKHQCADGTYSTSTGKGTCSHHGGIVR